VKTGRFRRFLIIQAGLCPLQFKISENSFCRNEALQLISTIGIVLRGPLLRKGSTSSLFFMTFGLYDFWKEWSPYTTNEFTRLTACSTLAHYGIKDSFEKL
jgi:hypothetical protein